MTASFRRRLLDGERLLGTIVSLDSPEVVEVLAATGLDWLFLDAEHAPLTPIAMQRLLQAAGATPCIIRLADDSEISIRKALDSGAAGIIVPQVNTAGQAARVVRRAKYAPQGTRGIGIARANRYGLDVPGHLARANDETAVIVQAEHIEAVDNIRQIAAVGGIDAVFVGPYDLSASMGKTGQLADPAVVAAIDRVTDACNERGMRLGIFGAGAEAVKRHIDNGHTLIACGVDTLLIAHAASAMVKALGGPQGSAQ